MKYFLLLLLLLCIFKENYFQHAVTSYAIEAKMHFSFRRFFSRVNDNMQFSMHKYY